MHVRPNLPGVNPRVSLSFEFLKLIKNFSPDVRKELSALPVQSRKKFLDLSGPQREQVVALPLHEIPNILWFPLEKIHYLLTLTYQDSARYLDKASKHNEKLSRFLPQHRDKILSLSYKNQKQILHLPYPEPERIIDFELQDIEKILDIPDNKRSKNIQRFDAQRQKGLNLSVEYIVQIQNWSDTYFNNFLSFQSWKSKILKQFTPEQIQLFLKSENHQKVEKILRFVYRCNDESKVLFLQQVPQLLRFFP